MKHRVEDITIIIPSLNPDEKFIKTLDGILDKGFSNLIVVDDGSDDAHLQPFQYALEKGCTVLTHNVNKGKGRALKTAFLYCLDAEECIGVITVDGDGQHGPDDIYACGQKMLNTDSVVLGCRDFSEPQVPFKSKYGNNITKFAFRALCGIKISDTQTGLRAIPAKFLPAMIEMKGERFEYETNMLLEMKTQNIPWTEQKIETIYLDDNASSHFHPLKDSWKIYKIIFKYSFSSGLSAIIDLGLFYVTLSLLENYGLSKTSENIVAATILARICSSLVNYFVNQKIVFQSKNKTSFFRYYALCIIQLIASAGLVAVLSTLLPTGTFGKTIIKLAVDTTLFFISFGIQKEWVFKKNSKELTEFMKNVKSNYEEV